MMIRNQLKKIQTIERTLTISLLAFWLASFAPSVLAASDAAKTNAPSPAEARANPFLGERLYVDLRSNAYLQIDEWKLDHPDWALELVKIAEEPQADWFLESVDKVESAVRRRMSKIEKAKSLPVMVAYHIPKRDCDSYSAGGAESEEDYGEWIRHFAKGIGKRKAIVILEPDALADIDTQGCLSPEEKRERIASIRDAVTVLKASPKIYVYLDAGNDGWIKPERIAELLSEAGIDKADGFALNVSNFVRTEDTLRYGDAISRLADGKHYLIDTSRNGLGPAPGDAWCNPPGRGLGEPPTVHTGSPLCDAYLWIKTPGESDGDGPECHDGPKAGIWWPENALDLAKNSPDVTRQ